MSKTSLKFLTIKVTLETLENEWLLSIPGNDVDEAQDVGDDVATQDDAGKQGIVHTTHTNDIRDFQKH